MQNTPGGSEILQDDFCIKLKSTAPTTCFLGLCGATSPCKNPVKNRENELFPVCDSEANFSCAKCSFQFLKAEAMGVVLAVSIFGNARATQPHQRPRFGFGPSAILHMILYECYSHSCLLISSI
jgi:hypothetical protein